MTKFLLVFFIFLQLPLASLGAVFNFLHWDIKDGLSNNEVVDLAYDRHENLWIATEAGLNLFDGKSFILFDTSNSKIAGDALNTLFYDQETDKLWIGTKSGVSIIDCDTRTFLSTEPLDTIQMDNNIMSFSKSKDGMWIANRFGKIIHLNKRKNKVDVYSSQNVKDLPNGYLKVFDNHKGEVYIGHIDHGMSIFNPDTKTVKRIFNIPVNPNSLPGNRVYSIIEDNLENIWIGTHQGLALYNPLTGNIQSFRHIPGDPTSLQSDHIYMLNILNGHELWIASDIGGISILDLRMITQQNSAPIRFANILATNNSYGISSRNARCVLQDNYGNVWIANHSSGIDLICNSEPIFKTFPYFNSGIDQNPSYGIYTDEKGMWIGNGNEIALFQNKILKDTYDFSIYLSRPHARINSILNIGGKLLLGLYDDGLLEFDLKDHSFTRINPLGNKDIFSIYKTKRGSILIGSHGIFIYKDGKITDASDYNKITGYTAIYSIIEDKAENLWIATYGAGFYVFDKNAKLIHHYDIENGLCSNIIHQFHIDANGSVWIATRNGLGYIKDPTNPKSIKNYTYRNGLNDEYVHAVTSDSTGNIWFSTNKGISRLKMKDMSFRHYDHLDGLPRCLFMDHAVAKDSSGTIYFGSQKGVYYFNPIHLEKNIAPSPVRILGLTSIFNEDHLYKEQPVTPDKDGIIQLPHDKNSFIISFSIADISQSDKVEYSYMLDGIDQSWIPVKNETSVTFRNLPFGKYKFKVRARLYKQSWENESLAEQTIEIAPPIWFTWYARILYICVILALGFLLMRHYKSRLENQNRMRLEQEKAIAERNLNDERLKFYTNVTHELRTPLTLILGPLEDMAEDPKFPKPYNKRIKTIRDSAAKLLDLVNQLLEFRKTETHNKRLVVSRKNIAAIVRETGLRYQELNRNPNVEFNINIALKNPIIYFDTEIIRTILNNLLSNAVKYTPSGSISVGLKDVVCKDKEYVELSVSDTGYGMEQSEIPHIFDRFYQTYGTHQASGTGIGLSIVKAMVELHEGILDVKSEIGKGTAFYVRLLSDNTYPTALHNDTDHSSEVKATDEKENNDGIYDNKPLILVIEDNDDIRDYILESLRDYCKVIAATNGKDGVEMAISKIPDIIISDIMMPVMDGIQACKILKSNIATSHIPIILLTAKNTIEDKERGYETGADSYITKPFSAKLLLNRIKNLLDTRRRLYNYIKDQLADNVSADVKTLQEDQKPNVINDLDDRFLSSLISIIEDNITSERLDMEFVMEKFNMSHSTLYRKVKGLTGMSTNEFIQKVKLRHAATLLKKGGMNVNEVAYASGFNSLSYFSAKFRKEYGVNSSQFQPQS